MGAVHRLLPGTNELRGVFWTLELEHRELMVHGFYISNYLELA